MKKKLIFGIPILAIFLGLFYNFYSDSKKNIELDKLRAQHKEFLDNSPYKETLKMTRAERKSRGLPPNAYNEQMWELTMDPSTGRPMPERIIGTLERLKNERGNYRGVGGDASSPWIDRGPNNQGGRTRGILFDPNDVGNANPADDYTKVFAGGVSGGLWVNNDITDVNSTWSQVPGIPANISVTVIITDPNASNIFYIGSGESYTQGDAIGSGIWKSTDSGATWTHIFGGYTGTSNSNQFIDGIFYINDLIARDVAGNTELYASVGGAFFGNGTGYSQWHGLNEMGLYKSLDDGENWTRFAIQHPDGSFKNANDIELDINNNIWFTTTSNNFGNPGGDIYKSSDGITFTLEETLTNAARTELEVSATDANKFWVAANVGGEAALYTTNDAFTTISAMNEPNDVDTGIPSGDYTRGQAFYDLPIEADAGGILYVGGIDLFRTADDGINWTQLSKWSDNNNLATLNNFVHADQHTIVFRPGDDNQAALGCDGGVFFVNNMNNAASNLAGAIVEMEKNYNTVQFYYGSIDQANMTPGDDLAGGTQDNGTFFKVDATPGTNGYLDPLTGDGGYTEIDGADGYAVTFYPGNSGRYIAYPALAPFSSISITIGGGGSFINQAELDTNLDILYTNATSGSTYRLERVREFIPGGPAQNNFYVGSGTLTESPSALKVSPHTTTSTTLYVGQRNGVLWKVTDIDSGGGTWTIINPGVSTFLGSISDIELGQSEMEIFVTMHNYGVPSIWYTTDGGATWVNKEGDLPDLPVKCILRNPLVPREVIIGTELGVWRTQDFYSAAPTWVQSYNGMSDVTVLDLDIRLADNTILATTHGRGMFTSMFTGISWTGATNNDWDTASNWDINGVPSSSDHVTIPSGLTNYPTASSAVNVISATINSGASLIAQSTFTGSVTYNRNIGTTNWYLISSPVIGQDVDDFVTASALETGSGSNLGFGYYNTADDTWSYYQDGTSSSDTFTDGQGYTVNLAGASGSISFTGTMNVDDAFIALTTDGNGFNLLGNPYPSYINSATLLTASTGSLLTETIWVWDQSANSGAGGYEPYVTADNFQLAPAQGFFVQSNGAAGDVAINEAFQSHQGSDTFLRSAARPEVYITLSDGSNTRDCKIYYMDGTTTGFDNGYDGPMFGGVSNSFAIYTHAVANGLGRDLAIQSLPDNDYENLIVPIGINADSGMEISISGSSVNLPVGINLYVEDTSNNTLTLLNDSSDFTTTLTTDLSGIGRFYLHTTSSALSVNDNSLSYNLQIYTTASPKELIVKGQLSGATTADLYDLQGRLILSNKLDRYSTKNTIDISSLSTGIYIVQVDSGYQNKTQKVLIK